MKAFTLEENDVYEFLEHYRWEGSTYEKGINDKTKINRLLVEISDYRHQILRLEKENRELKEKLAIFGIIPYLLRHNSPAWEKLRQGNCALIKKVFKIN